MTTTTLSIATNTFILSANSAWETLLICDRQGRKDALKIYRFLTSDNARRHYRMILGAIQITWMFGVWMFYVCRDWLDELVERSLDTPAVTSAVPEVAVLDDPWDLPIVSEVAIAPTSPMTPTVQLCLPPARSKTRAKKGTAKPKATTNAEPKPNAATAKKAKSKKVAAQ